ncbi:hypothetical protein RvY_16943 [Ramazzottius varieornatus]|uniref:FAD-binding PCMH-type domain-containing protein n=1 Tax=Ramazzottius varieornatus TaxID=947166 RepID=A0A1D1W1A3_RAMVA|nr:hypothetical protein RvY_16943 [Ramazzottius varieornatus]
MSPSLPDHQNGIIAHCVSVTVNGVHYSVPNTYSEVSLNDFLRHHLHLTGTKVTCREGGCGVCTVHVSLPDPAQTGHFLQRSLNSCLCPILSCDGWQITTVEGIGHQGQSHPIQQALTDHYATQCGYCTPGWIMNMYSLLRKEKGKRLTTQQIEDNFDGNFCRCTGYRPILDAFKTFSRDEESGLGICDVEDADKSYCKKSGKSCVKVCTSWPSAFIPHVSDLPPEAQLLAPAWHKPTSLAQLYRHAEQKAGKNVYYVVGHTGKGLFDDGPYDAYVDLKGIAQLYTVTKTDTLLSVGANTSLTDLIDIFERQAAAPGFAYLNSLVSLIGKTAHVAVRNVGSWAGNLAMKNRHKDFSSDIFVAFTTANAKLLLGPDNQLCSMEGFLTLELRGKVILQVELPAYSDDFAFRLYKVMPRATNAYAYCQGGFRALVDKQTAGKVIMMVTPALVFANIAPTFVHAEETENYLTGQDIADPQTLATALDILNHELQPSQDLAQSSALYRRSLAVSLFYKFILQLVGDLADIRLRSAVGAIVRPLSSGTQSFETKAENWPVTKALPKLESLVQCTGEAKFISDIEEERMLHAAFALSTEGSATIAGIDTTVASKFPGVIRIVTASEIPGRNSLQIGTGIEEMLASEKCLYAGQPVALVIAVSSNIAEEAAKLVVIHYADVKSPILTCEEAIGANSFFDLGLKDLLVGDAESSMDSAQVVVEGQFHMGAQQHFHTETMVTVSYPTEDGLDVQAGTQFVDNTQAVIAQACGLSKNQVNVSVRRNGGGFGAKEDRINFVAAASAVGAYLLRRPVKMHLSLWDNFKIMGRRPPYYVKYRAATDGEGKLAAVILEIYLDAGCTLMHGNERILSGLPVFLNNVYNVPAWKITRFACKTNTPANTFFRGPMSTEAVYMMEYIMEHIAHHLHKSPIDIRQLNFLKEGDTVLMGTKVTGCGVQPVLDQLLQSADYQSRVEAIQRFNKAHRWRKRGIAIVPMRFPVHFYPGDVLHWNGGFTCMMAVYHGDASIAVTHGGIELGQGINTKIVQVVARELGVSMDLVRVKPTNTMTSANARATLASLTSELTCLAAIECCKQLNDRLRPVKEAHPKGNWESTVEQAYKDGLDLSARAWYNPRSKREVYSTYCAMCSEVEVDILTGQYQIARLDCLYDCGESISPYIDIGQVEGAIVMGLGYFTSEEIVYDAQNGQNMTAGTLRYKPPFAKDIPVDFRVSLLKNAPNPSGVLRSKLVQEPPLCATSSVVFALAQAIQAARDEGNADRSWWQKDIPMTVEKVQRYCQTDISQMLVRTGSDKATCAFTLLHSALPHR